MRAMASTKLLGLLPGIATASVWGERGGPLLFAGGCSIFREEGGKIIKTKFKRGFFFFFSIIFFSIKKFILWAKKIL